MKRAARRSLFPLLLLALLSVATVSAIARADEPPALPAAPVREAPVHTLRQFSVEFTVNAAWAHMGDWRNGIADLEARSRADGLPITSATNPAYTASFEAIGLVAVGGPFFAGLEFDRPTGASEFDVRDALGMNAGTAEFETRAGAASNAWLVVGRWMLPGARRGVRPYLQSGAGVGSAQLEFTTPSGGAEGKGHAFVGALAGGLLIGDGPLRARLEVGWRLHRVPLSYSRVRGTSQPGELRDYFDFDDETRAFVTGRDVDLSGGFARIGVAVAFSR